MHVEYYPFQLSGHVEVSWNMDVTKGNIGRKTSLFMNPDGLNVRKTLCGGSAK